MLRLMIITFSIDLSMSCLNLLWCFHTFQSPIVHIGYSNEVMIYPSLRFLLNVVGSAFSLVDTLTNHGLPDFLCSIHKINPVISAHISFCEWIFEMDNNPKSVFFLFLWHIHNYLTIITSSLFYHMSKAYVCT